MAEERKETDYSVSPCPVGCDSAGHTVTVAPTDPSSAITTLSASIVSLSPIAIDFTTVLQEETKRLQARSSGGGAGPQERAGLVEIIAIQEPQEHRVAVRCPLTGKWFVLRVEDPGEGMAYRVVRVTTIPGKERGR